jgi:hypothetical protein
MKSMHWLKENETDNITQYSRLLGIAVLTAVEVAFLRRVALIDFTTGPSSHILLMALLT